MKFGQAMTNYKRKQDMEKFYKKCSLETCCRTFIGE